MPIFFQQNIDQCTRLAVWKIEEPESFFSGKVPLQRTITHPHKRLQHLAGRFLLKELFSDFPIDLIQIADTRKPFLKNEAYHFSISHCGDYAAVIASKDNRVGIDLEIVSEKVERIRHKFISEREEALFLKAPASAMMQQAAVSIEPDHNDQEIHLPSLQQPRELSTLVWSCKEAVFKWYGLGGVDFREHIEIRCISVGEDSVETIIEFKKNEALFLDLTSRFLGGVCLSYVVT
jgi:phosphopantetheinyl transferase